MRFVRLTILCIALGFVTTVAVAWGIAAWVPLRLFGTITVTPGGAQGTSIAVVQFHRRGATWRSIEIEPTSRDIHERLKTLPIPSYADELLSLGIKRMDVHALNKSGWGDAPGLLERPPPIRQSRNESASGLPFHAAWYGVLENEFGGQITIHGGIPLGRSTSVMDYQPALPLRPIWTGLAINTVFYAALWLIPFGGVGIVRRWRRRRRGQCTGCAYDRKGIAPGQPCPECGLTPPSPKATPTTA